MYQRILVPLDGSATAQRGFEHALGLARTCGASLVLLHVVELYPMMIEAAAANVVDQVARDLRAHGERVLERARHAAIAVGVACESWLEESPTARVCDVIVEQAVARHCDLVVMGTHGRRGLAHALIGSDAERVIRTCPVPVLLVRAPEQ